MTVLFFNEPLERDVVANNGKAIKTWVGYPEKLMK